MYIEVSNQYLSFDGKWRNVRNSTAVQVLLTPQLLDLPYTMTHLYRVRDPNRRLSVVASTNLRDD